MAPHGNIYKDCLVLYAKLSCVTEGWSPYRTEWSVYDDKKMIAGQIDCIFLQRDTKEYHMVRCLSMGPSC